jgi:hypothetical protein
MEWCIGERSFFGPDIIQEVEEKVRLIKDRKATQTINIEKSPMKQEIELILGCHPFEESRVLE